MSERKNILYILQQSIYNNNSPPKWLTLDSNINMMVGALKNILPLRPDWHFYVLIAPIEDFANIESYLEIMDHPNVHWVPYRFPVNAFLNRQHFDTVEFGKTVQSLPPIDVVWNNITELTRNIKTWFFCNKSFKFPKFITCCYWLDCQEIEGQAKVDKDIAYQWRQFDGFEASDLAAFTCHSTKDAFLKNASKFINPQSEYLQSIDQKSAVWDFGYDATELESGKCDQEVVEFSNELKLLSEGLPIIVFLNRMSDNNYTRHKEFISAIHLLKESTPNFRVVFANPSQKMPWEWLRSNCPNILEWRDRALTRKEYIALLYTAKISVHLYENELYGGCAHREAVHCNNRIVCPQVNEYAKIHGVSWPFYCEVSPQSIAKSLGEALNSINNNLDLESIERAQNNCFVLSAFENIAHEVVEGIESL